MIYAPTFERPAGNPAQLASAASTLAGIASSMLAVDSNHLASMSYIGILNEARTSFAWTGDAADRYGDFLRRRNTALGQIGRALNQGALALAELGIALLTAQQSVDRAQGSAQIKAARAQSSTDPSAAFATPWTNVVTFSPEYAVVASAHELVNKAKEDAAAAFRRIAESAPHFVPPAPKPSTPARKNSMWDRVKGGLSDAADAVGDGYHKISGGVHIAMDVGGQVPGLGEPLNLIDAGLYVLEGDGTNAAISASGAIPIAGNATTAGRLAMHAGRGVNAARHADDAADAARGAEHVASAARHVDDAPSGAGAARGGSGSDKVRPVDGTGDAGYWPPKRDPQPSPGNKVDPPPQGPKPLLNQDINTGYDSPVETDTQKLLEALRNNIQRNQP